MEIPKIVEELLADKAENNNSIDLDAYANGLLDMHQALQLHKTNVSGSCYNCKHWVNCNYATQGYSEDYKVCNIAEEDKSDGLFDAICSSERIGGELITHKNFGCVLHNYR